MASEASKSEDMLVLRTELSGVQPDEVKISVDEGVLTISGEHSEEKEEKKDDYVRRERRYGSFSRSMPVPSGFTEDDVNVTKDGDVLEVRVSLPEGEQAKAVESESKGE